MKRSILWKYILPFLQWYSLMIFLAIGIDYILHKLGWVEIGKYFGYVGTAVILSSFIYSLRKRKIITFGSPKKHLEWHEYLAWTGSILVLVHAGIHFNAILPWLAILLLLIAVATGLVGKFLLQRSSEALKEKKQELLKMGIPKEEADKLHFFDSVAFDLMKKWRMVHLPITFMFGILVLIHIITVLIFSK